ncbi:MAG TPA: universal stress protein [Vicinamibacterales bacterium]|nr:universal stress protein [Vicinamibacterales bacterium]
MIELTSVLVAVDFSEASKNAIVYGRNLARAFDAELHVLHVADVISTSAAQFYPEGPGDPEAKAMELATTQLRSLLAAEHAADARVAVRVAPDPADAIVQYGRETHAGLIVLGTHGRTGVSRFFMGSVAEHVVRRADAPVLVVRPAERLRESARARNEFEDCAAS